ALAHYHAGHYPEAIRVMESATTGRFDLRGSAVLTASLARLGRLEEAREIFPPEQQKRSARLRGELAPYARDADRQDFLEALRMAGVQEEALERIS
ncbi:MAG TPA: hypothetical protein VHV27_09910, partial [Phenylobacterium sp.]|nr:hypothetical protein [Phenylobacterium sp.]